VRTRCGAVTSSLILVATMALSVVATPPVHAYPQEQNSCTDPSLHWNFQPNSLWTQSKQDWMTEGFGKLDGALDYDGTKLITVTQDSGISVQIQDKLPGNYGGSECAWPTTSLWVNSNYSSQTFYHNVAKHEMFHLGGANHGGAQDSFDGVNLATMSTCRDWTEYDDNVFEQDAHALENWLWSSLEYRQQNANLGFEQGTRFWGKTGGIEWTEHNSGGATGPGYIGWHAHDIYDYIYQTVRIENGNDTEFDYRAKANARASSPNFDQTRARVQLFRRNVDFPQDPQNPNTCNYPDGIVNPNGVPNVSGWILMTESPTTVFGTSWQAFTTSTPEFADPPTQEGYDFQVRIGGYAYNGNTGSYGQIHFDNVRDEGRS
jgi:hypothetical protein